MAKNRLIGKFLPLLFFLMATVTGMSQDTMTGIFNPNFKTLQTSVNGNYLTPPILNFNTSDVLTIEFDEIAEDRSFLRYSLQHCNSDWTPSSLVDSEFLDGFNVADITDYEYSQSTVVHYVHYKLSFPNEELYVTKSGNYLLKVYEESNPDEILLQVRIYVSEASAVTSVDITTRTDIDYNNSHQQLSLSVDCAKAGVQNIFSDLKVYVVQNSRQDNTVKLTTPSRVAGYKAYYEHLRPLIFAAGNEYRRFENISVNYPGMRIDEVQYYHPYYHATLFKDEPRCMEQYTYDRTQFGRYVIREYNSDQSEIEADYMAVHFALEAPHYHNYDIYIDSDFLNRRLNSESLMVYNTATDCYEKTLLMKQGSYNYQYIAVPKGQKAGLTEVVEGDKYQTVNEYTIFVYTRKPGDRYDRLISTAVAYSNY